MGEEAEEEREATGTSLASASILEEVLEGLLWRDKRIICWMPTAAPWS